MWGREARAGLLFVLASLLVGGAFREWRSSHETRFSDLVAILERRSEERAEGSARIARESRDSTTRARERPSRSGKAAPLRPAALEVDRATAADFERLPGIGPALAARIVADRERNGAFGTPEGLDRVPGIGPKILDRIRPFFASAAPLDIPAPAADSVSPNAN
jgi:competence ComEA-like helix-hairpin-helix protein